MTWDVLVISADLEARRNLTRTLQAQGCEPICAPNVHKAIETLNGQSVGLVFCDRDLPDGTYREFLAALRSSKKKARVVVTSRTADWDEYLDAMRLGAFDVIAAPCQPTDVEWMLIQARRDLRESAATSPAHTGLHRTASAS